MDIIQVDNLSLKFGKQPILNTISFGFEKGKITGLLGPNGAGKSSIIKVLAGLVFPNSGEITIHKNKKISFSELRNYCGYLIDTPSFYPYLSAYQNLKLIRNLSDRTVNIEELLQKVGLADVGKKKVKHFSTGMKQRLAIATALLQSPEILILDEPTSSLDAKEAHLIFQVMRKLRDSGVGVIFITHFIDQVYEVSDRITVLRNKAYSKWS